MINDAPSGGTGTSLVDIADSLVLDGTANTLIY